MVSIISALFIIAGRFIVKIFIKVFGWAMVIFFGKIPEEKSGLINTLVVLSLVWVILIIGISYPALTKPFYDYIPDQRLKHIITVVLEGIGVLIIPIIVGELSVLIEEAKNKTWKDYIRIIYIGYYYSFRIGFAMILMLLFAPFITLKRWLLRQKAIHISLMIKQGNTLEVLERICDHLNRKEDRAFIKKTNFFYRFPFYIVKGVFQKLMRVSAGPDKMIQGEKYQIYLNPMDIVIEGKKGKTDRIGFSLFEIMVFENAYMTYTKNGQELEEEGHSIYRLCLKGSMDLRCALKQLKALKDQIELSGIDYDERSILTMELFYIENALLKEKLPARQDI